MLPVDGSDDDASDFDAAALPPLPAVAPRTELQAALSGFGAVGRLFNPLAEGGEATEPVGRGRRATADGLRTPADDDPAGGPLLLGGVLQRYEAF